MGSVNATAGDYFTVLEEVSKYNVHLNAVERLWAVRISPSLPSVAGRGLRAC